MWYFSKIRIYCVALFSLFCGAAGAQQVILNTTGEQIVIYPDGSWRYYEKADSVLIDKNLKKEEMFILDPDPVDPFENPANNIDEIEDLMRLAAGFASLTRKQQKEASIALATATGDKFEVGAQLEQAVANKSLVEPDRIATLDETFDQMTTEVKAAKRHLKVCTKFADDAEKLVKLPAPRLEKALSKLMVNHGAYFRYQLNQPDVRAHDQRKKNSISAAHNQRSGVDQTRDNKRVTVVAKTGRLRSGHKANKASNDAEDRYASYEREASPCQILRQQIDPKSKQTKVIVQRRLLFTHTDEELRQYFRQQELVTCTAQLTQIDDNVFLSVEFSIASPNARKNFGALVKGSLLRISLLNKVEVNLYNIRVDRGRIDPYTGNTLFAGQYLIDKEAAKALARTEVDKVRVVWSTGYEDYDIYELDFFIDQLSCLYSVQ